MTEPLIPLNSLARRTASLRDELSRSAISVIDSGYYILGPAVTAFEQAFAEYCGAAHCIGVANGTEAMELALRAAGIGAGDKVAQTANAAMYSTTATLACGAEPVFVDVQESTSLIDPAKLEQALASQPGVRCVIVTHLYGRLADVEAIEALCRPRGILVLEDVAQAHGARARDGRIAGAIGDVACFSFYPTKNLGALGDGGAIVSIDDGIAARARSLRQYGWSGKYNNALAGGRNSRLDEMQARFLLTMLPHLDAWNERRRAIASRYCDGIRNARIDVPPQGGLDYVGHLFVVRTAQREELQRHLAANHVQTDIHYPVPDHRQACHAGRFDGVSLPVTERLASRVLTLPCFPELRDDEVERVIDACNRF